LKKRSELSTLVLLFLMAFAASCIITAHAVDVAKLQAANTAFEEAFEAVLAAEHAGANVTALLGRLNVAADLLAQAEMAYRKGNTTLATNKADRVFPIASEVQADAVTAEITAAIAHQNALWSTIAVSVIGAVAFIMILLLVWRILRKVYVKNMFDLKPEVHSE